nr:thioesterase family protein [Ilumatobacteraceae bacterium]
RAASGRFDADPHLWGFGGLHGGLTLAVMVSAMARQAPGGTLRSVTGQLHRALRDSFEVEVTVHRSSAALWNTAATATTHRGVHAAAAATFEAGRSDPARPVSPPAPAAPPPEACEAFVIPPELVPFAASTEIRPVGPNRPFAGGDEPTLTAWIRLLDDDDPPDAQRLVVLMDALAPSYAAVLRDPTMIPTVELSVQPSDLLGEVESPWILLHARTTAITAGHWVDERLEAWAPDGTHLGSGRQLRRVR